MVNNSYNNKEDIFGKQILDQELGPNNVFFPRIICVQNLKAKTIEPKSFDCDILNKNLMLL